MPNNYVLLERIELNASASSVTFANIPQTGYTDLKVVGSIRNSAADTNTDTVLTFNINTSSYSGRRLAGNGSSASSDTQSPTNGFYFALTGEGTNWTANTFSNGEIYIPNYNLAQAHPFSGDVVVENNAATGYNDLLAHLWKPGTAQAITSISLATTASNWTQYTTFYLYGIKSS